MEAVPFAQGDGGAPEHIRPVVFLYLRGGADVPLGPLGKLQRHQLYDTVLLRLVGDMNTLVDGKARNLTVLVV